MACSSHLRGKFTMSNYGETASTIEIGQLFVVASFLINLPSNNLVSMSTCEVQRRLHQ